jgi:nitrate/TMAO reductase-like tetraheme cytochrome c subunit
MKKFSLPFFLIILLAIFFSNSCSQFVSKIDSENESDKALGTPFKILFSHNISGETHPCGCRQFPLGGLPQVYGLFTKLKKEAEIFYVDTGDTFFPSSNIPQTMHESLGFAAQNLARALDDLGLKYFVPGDQDFAMGLDFLKDIANKHQFQFLISNLKDESTIKHIRFGKLDKGISKIFFLGFVNPEVITTKENALFAPVSESMKKVLIEIKNAGYDEKNPHHRLIVLSHAGIDLDSTFAKEFTNIDWVIGAHSQSFLRYSQDIGDVKIVQALSKNHYVGDISLFLSRNKKKDSYELHETREELEALASPNPMRDFINAHKTKINDLQIKEQSLMVLPDDKKVSTKKFANPQTCISCHSKQVDFWKSTPHSLAFATLMNVKEQNNLQCIKCHSLGLNDPRGFTNAKNIIGFKKHPIIDYWNKAHSLSEKIPSIRKLKSNEIKKITNEWMQLDIKSGIKHNFANVQCLNCHAVFDEHPFNMEVSRPKAEQLMQIKSKCLECHTAEQSPDWYLDDKKAHPFPNEKVFQQKLKQMSCPLN